VEIGSLLFSFRGLPSFPDQKSPSIHLARTALATSLLPPPRLFRPPLLWLFELFTRAFLFSLSLSFSRSLREAFLLHSSRRSVTLHRGSSRMFRVVKSALNKSGRKLKEGAFADDVREYRGSR